MMNSLTLEDATALLDACPLAVLLHDASGRIVACNRAFAGLTGVAPGAGVAGVDALREEGLLAPLLGSGTLINWIMPDGDERWLTVESLSLEGARGGARFYVDVTEKLRLRQERDGLRAELKLLSLKDETLTSLMNRRGLLHSLEPLIARSRRYDSPLSIIALGIEVPQERQKLLVRISYLLRDQTRWADLLGCNDDHDFLLILQETTRDSALLLVEKLHAHMQRISAGASLPVRTCFGVSRCQREDDAESLLQRAESALCEARAQQDGAVICR